MGPPDFIGIGGNLCGSDWLYDLVIQHPAVSYSPIAQREVHFFDACWDGRLTNNDVTRYHAYFPREVGHIAGEWSPDYMYHAWVPRLIVKAAPEAKILVCLRDPYDRYLADVHHWILLGLDRASLANVANLALFRSLYAYPLMRILARFPREQVMVLQYESCKADLRRQLKRTFDFLGVPDSDFLPADMPQPVEAQANQRVPGPLKRGLRKTFRRDADLLLELVPELDQSLWPSVASEPQPTPQGRGSIQKA